MDIETFLRITRNTKSVFTADNHPKYADCWFKLYWEIQLHFKPAPDYVLELVLITSDDLVTTQVVELDRYYIVVNLTQISAMSQIMEFCAFHSIDQDEVSIFYQNWEDSYQGETIVADDLLQDTPLNKLFTGSIIDIKVLEHITLSKEQKKKFKNSHFMGDIVNAEGFKEFFGVCIIFVITHEMAHYHYRNRDKGSSGIFLNKVIDLPLLKSNSRYFEHKLKASSLLKTQLNEELYCDYMATEVCWSNCVISKSIDPKLIGIAYSLLFNSMYFFSLQSEVYDNKYYEAIKIRNATALLRLIDLYENDRYSDNTRLFEEFISLFDAYCMNMALVLAKQNFDIDENKYNRALRDILKADIGGYLSESPDRTDPIEMLLFDIRAKASSLFSLHRKGKK